MGYRAIVLLLTATVAWGSTAASLLVGHTGAAALQQGETVPMPDFGTLPDGVLIDGVAAGMVTAFPDGALRVLLERVEFMAEAPAVQRTAAGAEILYVESGQILVSDELGIEGAYPAGSQLYLVAGVPYGVRVGGSQPAVLLRLSLQPESLATPTTNGRTEDATHLESAVLADLPLGGDLDAPALLFLARGTWSPNADLGSHTFAGPVALIAEEGTLSISGPSGIEGQLNDGRTIAFPAGVVNRQWNTGTETATAMLAGIVSVEEPLILAVESPSGQAAMGAGKEDPAALEEEASDLASTTAPVTAEDHGITSDPVERWRLDVAPDGRTSVKLVEDGIVFAASYARDDVRSTLYAVDAATGEVNWEVNRSNRFDEVKRDGGITFVEAYDVNSGTAGKLYAFGAITGEELWSYAPGTQYGVAYDVADGMVYVSDGEFDNPSAAILALDSQSGVEQWRFAPDADGIGASWSRDPVLGSGRVYVSAHNDDGSTLFALDARSGREIWRYEVSAAGFITDLIDDTIYFVTNQDDDNEKIHAIAGSTGAELWSFAPGKEAIRNIVEDDRRVFFDAGSRIDSDTLFCLNKRTGEEVWRFEPEPKGIGAPVLVGGVVFAGSYVEGGGASLYALDVRTGDLRWKFSPTGFDFVDSPTSAGNFLIVGTGSTERRGGQLFGVDLETGSERWRLATDTDSVFTPEGANGAMYAGTVSRRDAAIIAIAGAEGG